MADITPILTAGNTIDAATLANQQYQAGITQGVNEVNARYGQTASLTGPYIQAGAQATNAMTGNINPFVVGGQDAVANLNRIQGGPLDVNAYLDPSMNFSIKQGQAALERSAAARGGVLSGAALKDLTQYATGIASTNYNNAARLALDDRAQRIDIGQGLVNAGINANAQYAPTIQAGSNALSNQTSSANTSMDTLASLRQAGGANAANTTNSIAATENQSTAAKTQAAIDTARLIADNWDKISGWFSDENTKIKFKDASENIMSTLSDLYASDERSKKNMSDLSDADINKTLDGLKAKSYEYSADAQRKAPGMTQPGRQVGIIAQDMEKTPAGDMVEKTRDGTRAINIPKATSFALAALSVLGNKVKALEAKAK